PGSARPREAAGFTRGEVPRVHVRVAGGAGGRGWSPRRWCPRAARPWRGCGDVVMAPPAMTWDIRGKRVLVTGATSGIGLEAARSLAKQGAKVVLVGRDAAKTARCLDDVRASAPGAEVSSLLCDFSRQPEVRRLAEEVLRRYDRLDVLVNNAGTVFKNRTLTEAGIEATFAVNHLGYFLLTQLLLERIVASAPARIVNVASIGHRRGTMDFQD